MIICVNKETRKETNIENGVDVSIQWLEEFFKKSKERLIRAPNNNQSNIKAGRKTK